MDPLTHMVTGALAAQALAPEEHRWAFALVGAGAGVVPDIDFLARKAKQKLLFLKLHRGFTHSLLALPIIGGCAAASGALLFGAPFWQLLGASVAAAMTHALLDVIMHSTGLKIFWPGQRGVSLHLVVGLNPLTSSARCGERSLGVCLRCTLHSSVLSPLVLLLWGGFLLALLLPGWRLLSVLTLALGGLYLLACQLLRGQAGRVLRRHLRQSQPGADPARARVFPASFDPTVWIGVVPLAEGYEVLKVRALTGRLQGLLAFGPSATGAQVAASRQTETVGEFLNQAVFPHASVYPGREGKELVVWRDLAYAFSPVISLFAARVELGPDRGVRAEEFRERWDVAPERP